MTIQSEPNWAGEAFVAFEEHSFEQCVVLSGQNLAVNTVVGKVDRGIGGMTIPAVVGTGNGLMSLLFAGPKLKAGTYLFTCITEVANGGVFSVVGPNGALPNLTVGTAYVTEEICCTISDGSTDFAAADAFTVTVAAGTTATVVGTGNGTVTGISLGPDAQFGDYLVKLTAAVTNGGVVEVIGPDGKVVVADSITAGAGGTLVIAGRQINLTVTDGSTDFAKGDTARIGVFHAAATKVVAWNPRPTAYDGRQTVAGVLRYAVDASTADTAGVLCVRRAIVNRAKLAWLATVTAAEKTGAETDLDARGIVVAAAA